MSINNQELRTLSGLTTIKADIVELPSSRRAITINGNFGIKGQTIQKDANNKLSWGFVDDIEIPDNSITNEKLKDKTIENDKIKDGTIIGSLMAPDITFTTTGNLSANQFIATDNFSQTGTSTNGFNGDIQCPKLTTINNQTQAIVVMNGGQIQLYQYLAEGGPLTIKLDGQDGKITCEDLEVSNHTGTIDFNKLTATDIRCDEIELGKTGTPHTIIDSDGINMTGPESITINQGNFDTANGNIIVRNGGNIDMYSDLNTTKSIILDASTGTINLDALNLPATGSSNITLNSGGLAMSGASQNIVIAGNITTSAGDLTLSKSSSTADFGGTTEMRGKVNFRGDNNIDFVDSGSNLNIRIGTDTGNIVNSTGKLTMSKSGSTPAPTDSSSYTDWAVDVSNTNGHMRVGGNIICDGKIFGDVEGAITEEEVDCQRITCRKATPPLAGITGMILGAGAIISNDTTGTNELTIDADLSGIVANNITIIGDSTLSGNCNIGTGTASNITTTIGGTTSTDSLNVETTTIDLGSSTGVRSTIRTTIRGGTTLINGDKLQIGTIPQGTTPPAGTSLEGEAGQQTNNIYRNNVRFFNFEGKSISHDLAGTIQNFVILRSTTARQIQVAKQVGFANTSTVFTLVDTYFFENITAPTSVAKLDFDIFYRHRKGAPDLYVRVDSTSAGATPYNATFLKPRILANAGVGNEVRVTHSYFIVGLIPGNDYSFYPKFADTTSGSAIGDLRYGDEFGEMSLKLTWLESYLGVSGDPYAPSTSDEEDY